MGLQVLKLAGNSIKTLEEVKEIESLKLLVNIDFAANPVAKTSNYRENMYKIFPNLIILDGYDENGEEVLSEGSDDDEEYMEEPEDDYDEEDGGNLFAQLTEEQKAQMEAQGINIKEYLQGVGDDFGESGEDELDDSDDYGDEEGSDEKED